VNTSGLLDHQGPAAEQLLAALSRHKAALDGSDMGVGKTAQTLAVIRERKLPTLVVGPVVARAGWQNLGRHLGVEFSYQGYEMLRTGRTPFGQWENPPPDERVPLYRCSSCQMKLNLAEKPRPCPHHFLGIHCIEKITKKHNYGKFIWHPNIKQLAFDEVHRCAALDSLQSDMLVAAKRQRIDCVGLSATSGATPLDFRALGYVLGLHSYTDFYAWAGRRGCRKTPWAGFQFLVGEDKRKQIMADLHEEIFPERGCRVRIDDLGDKFPEVEIRAELYDLSEPALLAELYARMDAAIQALNLQRSMDGSGENPLTTLLRARQEIDLLKVPILVELANDAVASGFHVALFVNFRATVEELCRRLKTNCRVDGSQLGAKGQHARELCIARFQADEEPIIVCSAAAGSASISLHDVRGRYPRIGYVNPGVSAQQVRQLCGRLRRAGGLSKSLYRFVLAAGTVEEKLHKALSSHLNCMDALNDGDLWAANLPLIHGNISDIFDPTQD
jgi:hypothetical protein